MTASRVWTTLTANVMGGWRDMQQPHIGHLEMTGSKHTDVRVLARRETLGTFRVRLEGMLTQTE